MTNQPISPEFNMTPIIGPIISLLRSRKFMVTVMTLVVNVVIAFMPSLEAVRTELLTVFTFVGSALVVSIAYEDGQVKAQGQ